MAGSEFAGVLDLHIIEAVDLAPRKDKTNLQPYVIAKLESKDGEKRQTQPTKAPYRWGVSFNFLVFSLDDVLIIDVKDHFKVSSDVPRGTIKIPLKTLLVGQLADMWLPLTESDKKKAILGGKLHIEVTLKPSDPSVLASTSSKSKKKSLMLQASGSQSNLTAVGSFKVEDIGEINVVAPEGEFPLTADPRGPTPYSFNPTTGVFEIPKIAFSGFFVLDRDVKELSFTLLEMGNKRRVKRAKLHNLRLANEIDEDKRKEKRAARRTKRKERDESIMDFDVEEQYMNPKRRKLAEQDDDDRMIDIRGPGVQRARDVEIPVIEASSVVNSVIVNFGHSEEDAKLLTEARMKKAKKDKLELANTIAEFELAKEEAKRKESLEEADKMKE